MTGNEVANIIGQAAIFVTALASLIASIRNSRRIEEVHKATNSMSKNLVDATAAASKSAGKEEERTEERERQTNKLPPETQPNKKQ